MPILGSSLRRYLFRYAWDQRLPMLFLFVQLLLISALELAKPWPFRFVVDYVIGNSDLPFNISLSRTKLLFIACFVIFILYVLSSAVRLLNAYTKLSIGKRMVHQLRNQLYAHLQRLSLSFHHQHQKGDLIYRLTNDTQSLEQLYNNGILPLLTVALSVIGMLVILLRIDPVLAVTAMGILPTLLFLLRPFLGMLKKKSLKMREAESDVLNAAELSMAQIKLIQAFSQEESEYISFSRKSLSGLSTSMSFYLYQAFYSSLVNIVVGIWISLLIAIGGYQVMSGKITLGILVVFISYLTVMFISINMASDQLGSIRSASAGLQRVFELLHLHQPLQEGTVKATPRLISQDISFRDVTFCYDGIHPVLRKISLTIPSGSKVSIVGPTGSGKSTLVSLLPRFYEPQEGSIYIGDVDLRDFSLSSLRENMALVLQPPIVFPGTVVDNIRYGNPKASLEKVIAAAKEAQIHEYILSLPEGYDTYLGERAEQLSEGQKQRITIARALVRNVGLIILDEPTSAMDPETEHNVMKTFSSLTSTTLIVIAHRLSTVVSSNLIVVMNEGSVEESGTYEELISRDGIFARLHKHSLGLIN